MSRPSIPAGFAPADQGTGVPTFSALVRAVQERTGLSQNKSRRLTRDYLRSARHPNVPQLLEHVNLARVPFAYRDDPTGETAVRNVMRERSAGHA